MRLKEQLKQWQHSDVAAKRWVHYVAKASWRVVQFVSVPEIRSQRIVGWRYRNRCFQRSTFTSVNRYPVIFEQCKLYLANNPQPRILSFGCSTGEEVFSLADYLPQARIVGVDINNWCIRQCNQRKQSNNHSFCLRYSREFEEAGEFDAIFCMAVFQRTENRTSPRNEVSVNFRFEEFEREIGVLDTKLKHHGLLIIDHADFNFVDTVHCSQYKMLEFEHNSVLYNRPLFDKNNRKISDTQCLHRVFMKQ